MKSVHSLFLQKKLIEKFPNQFDIDLDEAVNYLMKVRVPKNLMKILLKEMDCQGLIKLSMVNNHRSNLFIQHPKECDILEHPAKIQHMLGCW